MAIYLRHHGNMIGHIMADHGSRGNRMTLSAVRARPQGSASWGHNHYHLRGDTQFQNISWELLIAGSTSVSTIHYLGLWDSTRF